MTRFIVPLVLVALAYGYWKYIAFADAEVRKRRLQIAAMWAVFALSLAAAARSGSAAWLIGTVVVMVAMRLLATVTRARGRPGSGEVPPQASGAPPNAGPSVGRMSRSEALQIFELGDNPSLDAIQKRYRDLMRSVHPDRGGSNYLAAKLNAAYQVLMAGQGH
jgi:hypothetical protein